MSSHKAMAEMEEEDEESLRRAALKTMSSYKEEKRSATETSGRPQQNMRTNTAIKTNNNKLYYNNSHRNGSKRSNLIVLTKTDSELSNSQTDSHSNRFTKIVEKNEISEKRKRVLPGRFSRLERDDDDTDEDSDEGSDGFTHDNQMTTNSAFNQESDEQTVISQNLTNENSVSDELVLSEPNTDLIDGIDSPINQIKDSTNGSINENVKSLATNSTTTDSINSCNNGSDLERKETIRLNSIHISKSDAIERRKQKFGQMSSEERVSSSVDSCNRNQRSSVKSRLSTKSSHKQKNSKTNERNYNKSVSDKEVVSSHRPHSTSRSDTMDELDDCHHSKKKLRSLVVMK